MLFLEDNNLYIYVLTYCARMRVLQKRALYFISR